MLKVSCSTQIILAQAIYNLLIKLKKKQTEKH